MSTCRMNFQSPTAGSHNRRSVVPQAFFSNILKPKSGRTSAAKPTLDKLLSAIDGTERGITTSPQQLAKIKECFEELEITGNIGTPENITGTWRLLWTTEKESLFILEKAGIFGTQAGEVYQVIDTAAGTLQNVIEFPPEGAFIVNSSLDWVGEGRTDFKFNAATLNLPNDKKVNLPPFGKGWFKSVYCDGKYRLSRDVRGDYLVVIKDGPPRKFD